MLRILKSIKCGELNSVARQGFANKHLTEKQKKIIEEDRQAAMELQKQYKDIMLFPTEKEEPDTLYYFLSKVPIFKSKTFLNFLTKNFDNNPLTEFKTDYFNPPRIHENSIFIYQSVSLSNKLRFARSLEILATIATFGFMQYPLIYAAVAGFWYYLGLNARYLELSRRLVTRMDLLPHLEMVHVQRLGSFGQIFSKLYRIQDLYLVNPKECIEKENYFWYFAWKSVDEDLIFRCKSTGEYLLFDNNGYWNKDGLEHELLN